MKFKNRYLENEFKILKITHYAHQMSKKNTEKKYKTSYLILSLSL